jgi:hypothetical protein
MPIGARLPSPTEERLLRIQVIFVDAQERKQHGIHD